MAEQTGIGHRTLGIETSESASRSPKPEARSPSVVVVGGASVDLFGRPDGPAQPRVSNPGRVRITPGGAGRNVAENLARLGGRVSLISAVHAGPLGDWLVDRTSASGVDVTRIGRVKDRGSYYVRIDAGAQREWAVADMSAVESLTPSAIDTHAELIRAAGAVVVDANLSPPAIRRAVELATGIVCVLPVSIAKSPRVAEVLNQSTVIVLTSQEAAALTARSTETRDEILHSGRDLQARGPAVVVITAGDQGMVWIGRDVTWATAAPTSVVDPIGAGDAVAALAVYSMLTGLDEHVAVRLAAAAGAMTVAVEGATHPGLTRDALNRYAELAKSL